MTFPRCTATTRAGAPCIKRATHGALCLQHAGAAGHPEAKAELLRNLASRPDDLSRYRDDPVAFAIEVLEVEPWDRQAELLAAVAGHDRVAVRSGHKTGKSTSMAIIALWFCATRPGARVVLTAPTYRQVRHVLWREVKRLARRLAEAVLDPEKINDVPEHGIQLENGSEMLGFSADSAEKFAGISGADLLFVIDEASGIEPEIYEAIVGSSAGDAKIVLTGNPTRPSGPLYDAFHDGADHWHKLHISSEETPNVTEGTTVIPGLATRKWVAERKADWGEGGPLYAVRVRGDWPAQSSQAVIGMALVDAATSAWRREAFAESKEPLVLGVDPARFGADESVIFAVRGLTSLAPFVFRQLDTIALAREVHRIAHELARNGETVDVRVDETGLGGGVVDQLRTMPGLRITAINAGESPTAPQSEQRAADHPAYLRRRDELWFGIADWLKRGGTIPNDRKLVGELVAVEYSFSPVGKIVVEPKDDLKKRIGRSPDRADALALAVGSVPRQTAWDRACAYADDGWPTSYV